MTAVSLTLTGAILANFLVFQTIDSPPDSPSAFPAYSTVGGASAAIAVAAEFINVESQPNPVEGPAVADKALSDLMPADQAPIDPAPMVDGAANDAVNDAANDDGDFVFAGESDDAVVDRMLAYFDALKTLKADFVQTSPSGAFSRGTVYLRRPGQMLFEYAAPSPLKIVATQGNVYVEDKDLETTDLYPIRTTPLKFLLTKNISLDDATVTGVDRSADAITVTLASTDEETQGQISLILAAPTLQLQQWAVRDPQNGVTIVSLENVEEGGKLANRLFRAPEAGGAFINN